MLARDAELWLDGCHNQGGAEAIAETLASWRETDGRPIRLIVGMKETKDATTYFRPFVGIAASVTTIPIPDETHYPPEGLAAVARGLGIETTTATDAREALERVPPGSRVLICGSLYLAGRILRDNG